MFGLGFGEIMVILVLGLVVLGPKRLPQLAAQAGRLLRQLRESADTVTQTVQQEFDGPHLTLHQGSGGKVMRSALAEDPSFEDEPTITESRRAEEITKKVRIRVR